ncbi:MAG: hypothetical protein LKK16_00400 [Bacteroidales bacterium]|jgi:endonuclease/exonuclease/phosphatase family metal-dependent hydrolase|nr:hypothetical protein [Bacteroidales bacterium]MCI2134774.1 hypothetical protein [Bacteroidales bacterium]
MSFIPRIVKSTLLITVGLILLSAQPSLASGRTERLRLLYWNIQNGMWDGQNDNYDRFVEFVRSQDPDICVWCEARTNYQTDTAKAMEPKGVYLPDNWGYLASRYGHKYWYIGAYHDRFPQVITSRYPIENVERIYGEQPDNIVAHGSGWARIDFRGNMINIVTVHTWPQKYGFNVPENARRQSSDRNEGDFCRRREIEYICSKTILSSPDADKENWMMMGDFNAVSRVDCAAYDLAEDSPAYLTHDYVAQNTPYIDAVSHTHKGAFIPSTFSGRRIDFLYCNAPVMKHLVSAEILSEGYVKPQRDARSGHNFCRPSDHLPILAVFEFPEKAGRKIRAAASEAYPLTEGCNLRILDDNIWDYSQDTIPPAWQSLGVDCRDDVRSKGFARLVRDHMPDVFTIQEYSEHMHQRLYPLLRQYGYEIADTGSDGHWNNTPIYYLPEKLTLKYDNYVLYTPSTWSNHGSKSYTAVVFTHNQSGKDFAVLNTHLWWKSDKAQSGSTYARAAQVNLMLAEGEIIREKYNCPIFVTGDMNCEEDTLPIRQWLDAGYIPCYRAATIYGNQDNGHHICGPKDGFSVLSRRKGPERSKGAIDHCFIYNASLTQVRVFDCIQSDYLVQLTDHYPNLIDIELK